MKKYQLNLEPKYMNHYEEVYFNKNLTHLKGAEAKDFFERLEHSQQQAAKVAETVLDNYRSVMNKLIDQIL